MCLSNLHVLKCSPLPFDWSYRLFLHFTHTLYSLSSIYSDTPYRSPYHFNTFYTIRSSTLYFLSFHFTHTLYSLSSIYSSTPYCPSYAINFLYTLCPSTYLILTMSERISFLCFLCMQVFIIKRQTIGHINIKRRHRLSTVKH